MPVEQDVMTILSEVDEEYGNRHVGNRFWTSEIKRRLLETAAAYQYAQNPGMHPHDKQFLFDLIWSMRGGGDSIQRFVLVIECEWRYWRRTWEEHREEVLYDFRKLLLARADYRMMIFDAHDPDSGNCMIRRMCDEVIGFNQTQRGDHYLFACWVRGRQPYFAYEPYTV